MIWRSLAVYLVYHGSHVPTPNTRTMLSKQAPPLPTPIAMTSPKPILSAALPLRILLLHGLVVHAIRRSLLLRLLPPDTRAGVRARAAGGSVGLLAAAVVVVPWCRPLLLRRLLVLRGGLVRGCDEQKEAHCREGWPGWCWAFGRLA